MHYYENQFFPLYLLTHAFSNVLPVNLTET